MNRWLQTRRYWCPACGSIYLHDQAYRHAVVECPARPLTKPPVLVGKTYEPKAGR